MSSKRNKNIQNFLVNRNLFAKFDESKYEIPVLWRTKLTIDQASKTDIINFSNIKNENIGNEIIEFFSDDYKLNPLWNSPYNKLEKFKNALAVLTPDFSITPSMKEAQIIENTYKNRWLGCFYQQYSIDVIPTISWANENTYEICSQGLIKYNPFAISTVCANDKNMFIKGFNYFMKRFEPEYVICYGRLLDGMYGKIIQYNYEDAFKKNKKYETFKLVPTSRFVEIEKSVFNQ